MKDRRCAFDNNAGQRGGPGLDDLMCIIGDVFVGNTYSARYSRSANLPSCKITPLKKVCVSVPPFLNHHHRRKREKKMLMCRIYTFACALPLDDHWMPMATTVMLLISTPCLPVLLIMI